MPTYSFHIAEGAQNPGIRNCMDVKERPTLGNHIVFSMVMLPGELMFSEAQFFSYKVKVVMKTSQ